MSLGFVLERLGRQHEAIVHYQRVFELDQNFPYAAGRLLFSKLASCDWGGIDALIEDIETGVEKGLPKCEPLIALVAKDSPALHRRVASIFISDKYPKHNLAERFDMKSKNSKIRLGYFSSDFRNHAVSRLIVEVLEAHDRDRFEINGFSFGPSGDDDFHKRVVKSFDSFFDISGLTDDEAFKLVRKHSIDIAIDLNGHTLHARTGIFARRCAPVQVNYLGYPGSMASDYHDYIIADGVVIPEGWDHHFSEFVVRLPGCYQANDSKARVASHPVSRANHQLPQSGVIFCCFNSAHKILPDVFDDWAEILRRVDGSVLWLLDDNLNTTGNLRREAERRGISPNRLVFESRLPVEEHLARCQLADVFLDTFPYTAHTTASDSLRVGTPLITRVGESFASRVAASLLINLGLPDLVVSTREDYVTLAVDLGLSPSLREGLRRKLRGATKSSPVFSGFEMANKLEGAYERMLPPASIQPNHLEVSGSSLRLMSNRR
jgi:predicted O-linked N-acetylglucosamine transferase (SPINDLY family)